MSASHSDSVLEICNRVQQKTHLLYFGEGRCWWATEAAKQVKSHGICTPGYLFSLVPPAQTLCTGFGLDHSAGGRLPSSETTSVHTKHGPYWRSMGLAKTMQQQYNIGYICYDIMKLIIGYIPVNCPHNWNTVGIWKPPSISTAVHDRNPWNQAIPTLPDRI